MKKQSSPTSAAGFDETGSNVSIDESMDKVLGKQIIAQVLDAGFNLDFIDADAIDSIGIPLPSADSACRGPAARCDIREDCRICASRRNRDRNPSLACFCSGMDARRRTISANQGNVAIIVLWREISCTFPAGRNDIGCGVKERCHAGFDIVSGDSGNWVYPSKAPWRQFILRCQHVE